jgi:hypothetical protein
VTSLLTGHLLDKHDRDLPGAPVVLIPVSGPTSDRAAKKVHAAVVAAITDANGNLALPDATEPGVPLIGGEQYRFRAPGASNVLPELTFTMPLNGSLDISEITPEPVALPPTFADQFDELRALLETRAEDPRFPTQPTRPTYDGWVIWYQTDPVTGQVVDAFEQDGL